MLTITASPTSRDNATGFALRFRGRIVADCLSDVQALRLAKGVKVKALREALSAYETLREHAQATTTPEAWDAVDRAYVNLARAANALGYRGEPGGVERWSEAFLENGR